MENKSNPTSPQNSSPLDELYFVLDRLVALHRNLIDILREEYGHMAALDVKGLVEAAQTKEVLLSEIWNHEQLRIKAAERVAPKLGLSPKDVTLLDIAKALTGEDAQRFHSTRAVLQMLVSDAKEINTINMAFAEESLGRIEEMKRNVLGTNNNNNENYSNSGVRQPITEQGGRLLSTEA